MITQIKRLWWQAIRTVQNLPCAYRLNNSGYLKRVGYFRSCRERIPVDGNNNPLPWYSYPAINFLDSRSKLLSFSSKLNVFEYGTGYSTIWWSKRCKTIEGCEHNPSWYEKVKLLVPSNVSLIMVPENRGYDYERAALKSKKLYDIIIIDGIKRNECAQYAVDVLSESGVIVWDDSARSTYHDGIKFLTNSGFRKLDFVGLGPITNNTQSTSIFYRDNNLLGI